MFGDWKQKLYRVVFPSNQCLCIPVLISNSFHSLTSLAVEPTRPKWHIKKKGGIFALVYRPCSELSSGSALLSFIHIKCVVVVQLLSYCCLWFCFPLSASCRHHVGIMSAGGVFSCLSFREHWSESNLRLEFCTILMAVDTIDNYSKYLLA